MKVDLGQILRLVVSLWQFVVLSFRHVVWSFCYGVSSSRHADFWSWLGQLPVRLVGWSPLSFHRFGRFVMSFHRFVMSFRRFVMAFRRFDSFTQRGHNSTYITWSVYLIPCTYYGRQVAGDKRSTHAILISTLLLQTHARQLYSLALTRFWSIRESSTTNAWNVWNVI